MKRYVCIGIVYQTGFSIVFEIHESDEGMPTTSPAGSSGYWIEVSADTAVQVGWKVEPFIDENGNYLRIYTEPTEAESDAITTARMKERFDDAARWLQFNPLQYKQDLGVATPADEAALFAYKQYVVAVSEVKKQPGYPSSITWPVAPF